MSGSDPKHNATLVTMAFDVTPEQQEAWKEMLERFFESDRLLQDCLKKSERLADEGGSGQGANLRDALGKARRERSRHRCALERSITENVAWMRAFRLDLLNRQLHILQGASRKNEMIQCLLQIARIACTKDAQINAWTALVRLCPHHQYFRDKLKDALVLTTDR